MGFKSISAGLVALAFGLTSLGCGMAKQNHQDSKITLGAQHSLIADASLEQIVERATADNMHPEDVRLYKQAGVSSFSTMDYLAFLGIDPGTVFIYAMRGVFETSDIIKKEFSKGAISPRAKELFDFYNITHPERYDINIVDQLLISMKGGSDKPGLFVFFDEEMFQKKVEEENAVLEFSENLLTRTVKEGYAGKYHNTGASLMIFEMDNNFALTKKVHRAKQMFDEYYLGEIFVDKFAEDVWACSNYTGKVLNLFFREDRAYSNRLIINAITSSDNLKIIEAYADAGVDDYEMFEIMKAFGITPEKVKSHLTQKQIKKGVWHADSRTLKLLFSDISEDDKQMLDHYSIWHPWLLSPKLFKELKENMSGIPQDGRPLSLVLVGQDPKEGFLMKDYENLLKGYHLLIYEVSDDNTAIKRITEVGKRYGLINLLWIEAL